MNRVQLAFVINIKHSLVQVYSTQIFWKTNRSIRLIVGTPVSHVLTVSNVVLFVVGRAPRGRASSGCVTRTRSPAAGVAGNRNHI